MIAIPLELDADYTITSNLDSVAYDLRFQWNTREAAWYMFIGLSGRAASAKMKLTAGLELLKPFKYLVGVPNGDLLLVDTVASFGRAGRNDMGLTERFNLIYVSEEELNAL